MTYAGDGNLPHADAPRDRALLLTPPGAAAIAVVRLVGPRVREFLAAHVTRDLVPGRPVHAEVRDGEGVLDDPVIVVDASGLFADVNLHGGAWVVRSFLELARREGFEVAEHPTPPLDAAAVDGSSALESEVLTHLPLATTELALRALLAQPVAWEKFKARGSVDPREIEQILGDRSLHWLLHPPRVAIVGPANAGKSTLANRLFAQDRSITADLPGTTRDWVGELANLDGLAVMLVDTPGLRETSDAVEAEAIALAKPQIERADLVVLVLDRTQPFAGEQERLLAHFPDAIVVVNKIDRPAEWKPLPIWLPTVATTGQGTDELRAEIRREFGCDGIDVNRPRWWTERQRDALRRAFTNPVALAEL